MKKKKKLSYIVIKSNNYSVHNKFSACMNNGLNFSFCTKCIRKFFLMYKISKSLSRDGLYDSWRWCYFYFCWNWRVSEAIKFDDFLGTFIWYVRYKVVTTIVIKKMKKKNKKIWSFEYFTLVQLPPECKMLFFFLTFKATYKNANRNWIFWSKM